MLSNPPPPSGSKLKLLIKIAVVVGIVAGVGIQFIPVKGVGDNPPERYAINAPPEVEAILRRSCLDCHSNETRWPWYSRLAPGSWLMVADVRKGRAHMNMSEWGETDEEERTLDKENSWDQIEAGDMPPLVYLPLHPDAILGDKEKAILKEWLLAKKPEEKADKPAEAPKAEAPPPAPTKAAQ